MLSLCPTYRDRARRCARSGAWTWVGPRYITLNYVSLCSPVKHVDTIDDAIVFCLTCRHGGHAAHILEWFYGSDGGRAHGMCAVAGCACRCADKF